MTRTTRPLFSIGIDLGTTNTVLACEPLDDPSAAAVLPVPQWASPSTLIERPTLPSFLYRPEADVLAQMRGSGLGEGDWIVGQYARIKAGDNPARVAHSAKSWLCHHGADREADFLPWGSQAIPAAEKISPVRAAALILNYLRGAWNDRYAGRGEAWSFDAQAITITVPASFDAAAQRLCLLAAEQAGYPDSVRLLEEPQAAFYTWLGQHGGEEAAWQALSTAAGLPQAEATPAEPAPRHVLVVDIGGGTSDFSLFAVDAGGGIRRIAVSEHILLGGDNIDLALAHAIEARLSGGDTGTGGALVGDGGAGAGAGRLDGAQWDFLVARCRDLKEQALARRSAEDTILQVAVPGRGGSLFAGTRTAEITRGEVDRIVLDGFFPFCAPDAAPRRVAAALKEWGLPYASDSAITRHLAHFLRGRPAVDAVLFNGGALYPEALRQRIVAQIARWQGRASLPALANDEPDLAVARGAARFGRLAETGSARITADAARAIFLEAQSDAASGGDGRKAALVCVLPRGAAADEAFVIGDLGLELRINRPVRFQAYASPRHGRVRAGDLIGADAPDLQALPPVETVARVDDSPAGARTVPVTLEARLNEVGLLQMACRSADPALRATWPLDFNLRHAAAEPGPSSPAIRAEANAPAEALAAAGETIAGQFARSLSARDRLTAQRLLQMLEKTLGLGRSEWNWVLVRSLWPALAANAERRAISPEHEETWLILAGYLLRPGFGAAADESRIDEVWQILETGPAHAAKRVKLQAYILWRRIAGGLSQQRQDAVLAGELDRIRRQDNLPPELVRMTGAFERLDTAVKITLIERYIARARDLAVAHKHCAPYLAALGMLLSRAPAYAGPEEVVTPDLVERAFDAFAGLDWADSELADLSALFLQAARVVGDRRLDVRSAVRGRIASRLEKLGIPPTRTARLRAHMPMTAAERQNLFGEALPPGLILRASG